MSTPIHQCEYPKAFENKDAFEELVQKAMQGVYSIFPCKCDPPCRILTDEEKAVLQDRINNRVAEIRAGWRKEKYEKDTINQEELTLEDICEFTAKYLSDRSSKPFTAIDVYELSPNHDIAYYLEMYEEAVFSTGADYHGRPAIEYFDERFLSVKDEPAFKVLAVRYQKAIYDLEQKAK